MQSPEWPDLRFVAPRAFGKGRRGWGNVPRVIVIHHTAGAERNTSAEDGAAYDARRTDGTSCHYFVDSNSVVQCVLTTDRANSAMYNGNTIGIQYELCGTLQSRAQWLDAASDATLTNAARQIARDCRKYGIPVRKLSPAQVAAGERGICGHADITYAFPQDKGTHTDPGPHFPWDVLLERVRSFITPSPPVKVEPTPEPKKEEDRMLMLITQDNQTVYVTDGVVRRPISQDDIPHWQGLARNGDLGPVLKGGEVQLMGGSPDLFGPNVGEVFLGSGPGGGEVTPQALTSAVVAALRTPEARQAIIDAVNAAEDS